MEMVEIVSIVRPQNCIIQKPKKNYKLKKKLKNSRKNSKTPEKTQKLKEKTQKVGTFGIPGCRKSVQTISLV